MHLEIISMPEANRQDNTFLWMGKERGTKKKVKKKTFSIMLIKCGKRERD